MNLVGASLVGTVPSIYFQVTTRISGMFRSARKLVSRRHASALWTVKHSSTKKGLGHTHVGKHGFLNCFAAPMDVLLLMAAAAIPTPSGVCKRISTPGHALLAQFLLLLAMHLLQGPHMSHAPHQPRHSRPSFLSGLPHLPQISSRIWDHTTYRTKHHML